MDPIKLNERAVDVLKWADRQGMRPDDVVSDTKLVTTDGDVVLPPEADPKDVVWLPDYIGLRKVFEGKGLSLVMSLKDGPPPVVFLKLHKDKVLWLEGAGASQVEAVISLLEQFRNATDFNDSISTRSGVAGSGDRDPAICS